MEPALPIQIETPKYNENEELKMIDIKSFDINSDNKMFKLELGKSEDKKVIIFKINENNNNFMKKYYLLYQDINFFYNLNIFFRIYQSIDEIYKLLLDMIINKKYAIKFEENAIILILELSMPGGKIIDIEFKLLEKKINKDTLIDNLYSIIQKILQENKEIKDELNILKTENIKIKSKLKNMEEYIETKKKEEKEIIFDLKKSKIVKKKKDKMKLKEWISDNGRIKEINLLYRGTKDGDSCESFFKKCGNKGPTISLIKSTNGKIFGGYSKAEWTDKKGVLRLYDNTAFLFSIDKMEKYKILKPELAICCYPNENCIVYGNNADNNGISLRANYLNKISKENHSTKVYDIPKDFFLSGDNIFNVEEVEVYQVIFFD